MLFSRLKTPPIIRTEDELKEKIALLEVKGSSIKWGLQLLYLCLHLNLWSILLYLYIFWHLISFFKALSDIQIAVKMVKSSEESDEHPLDRHYRSLQCQMQPLDSSCNEYKVWVLQLITVKMIKIKVTGHMLAQWLTPTCLRGTGEKKNTAMQAQPWVNAYSMRNGWRTT